MLLIIFQPNFFSLSSISHHSVSLSDLIVASHTEQILSSCDLLNLQTPVLSADFFPFSWFLPPARLSIDHGQGDLAFLEAVPFLPLQNHNNNLRKAIMNTHFMGAFPFVLRKLLETDKLK